MQSLPDGLTIVVKRDCPTCVLVEPVLQQLRSAGRPLTIVTQDDPTFPAGAGAVIYDRDLKLSWYHKIETVPTVIRVEAGRETARAIGWDRAEWEGLAGINGLGQSLPAQRPGCGSITTDPNIADALALKFGNFRFKARKVEIGAFEDDSEAAFDRDWSDGLPVVSPTEVRVWRMLQGTKRDPHEVLGLMPPDYQPCTVEKVAINAVMAGCKPEYMPVLIAAVSAISDPHFMMRNVAVSTGAHAPVMILNGPIVRQLGVNTGRCALGPGAQSVVNTTLGRTLRLIYMNLGHAYPGVLDMDTLGSPNKYSFCLGENEEENPWEPWHVERGHAPGSSVVTLCSTYAISEVNDNISTTPEGVLDSACSTACNRGVTSVGYWLQGWRTDPQAGVQVKDKPMLLVCPLHAAVFRKHGWSKQDIREYMFQHARMPFGNLIANKEIPSFRTTHPELQWMWDKPETLVPVFEAPESLEIVVAGATSGARSTYSYGAAEPVSRVIDE